MMKLYVAVLDEVPSHMVPVLVAHAVLGAHLKFTEDLRTCLDYTEWLDNSFKKCIIKVNGKEFDKILSIEYVYIGHENTVLEGKPSCVVVCPRDEYPNVLKFAKLWVP